MGTPAHSDRLQNKGKMFYYGHPLRGEIDFLQQIPGDRCGAKKSDFKATRVMRNAQSE
jgi:hypothetical protein